MIGKDEEVELPELNKILTKYMTGESKRPLWPYLTEALQKCLIPLRRRRRRRRPTTAKLLPNLTELVSVDIVKKNYLSKASPSRGRVLTVK